ncbi:MAG: TRAP transporter substrate-binding protein DctP [Desulfovermiculus sp.]|nr:TRAP transporter substrate-binding protein DctP [Desulfovermiculus sp.]
MKRREFVKAGFAGVALAGTAFAGKSFAAKPEYKFRMQSFLGEGWKEWSELVPRYIQRVKNMSGGLIEIEAYPPGALSPTFELMDMVQRNVVDIGFTASVYWKGIWPALEWAWGIPFALSVVEDIDSLWYERGLFELIDETYNTKNVKLLSPIYSDEWGATMSTKPIKSLKDFEGTKIRSFGIVGDILKQNGASVVTLPGEELYTALTTGTIDGANWGSPYGFMATKLHEVAKYYCGPSFIQYDAEDVFMNKNTFDSLPENLQHVMMIASRIFAFERASVSTMASYQAVGKMKEAGVEFSELPAKEVDQMKKITEELIWEKAKKDDLSNEVIKLVMDTKKVIDLRPRKSRS